MAKLTPKQKRFAKEWVIDSNNTQAAIRAGYSPRAAKEQGARLLTNVNIQKYIAELMDAKDKELIASQDEVLIYLTSVLRGESISETIIVEGSGMGCSEAKRIEKAPDEKEKLKAAELLGKKYNLFTDKLKIEGQIPTVIVDDLRDNSVDVIGFTIDSEGGENE